jgi:hypothetical protein
MGTWVGPTWSVVIAQALMHTPCPSPRSAPVSTATTLAEAFASAVSIDTIRA